MLAREGVLFFQISLPFRNTLSAKCNNTRAHTILYAIQLKNVPNKNVDLQEMKEDSQHLQRVEESACSICEELLLKFHKLQLKETYFHMTKLFTKLCY